MVSYERGTPARPFHQKSTCLTQLTLGPYVVKNWSRYARNFEGFGFRGACLGLRAWEPVYLIDVSSYRGTSLIRKRLAQGPYSRPWPRALSRSWGVGRFLMSKVPLYMVIGLTDVCVTPSSPGVTQNIALAPCCTCKLHLHVQPPLGLRKSINGEWVSYVQQKESCAPTFR